jgi:putative ABC transport system ATP-binding protein
MSQTTEQTAVPGEPVAVLSLRDVQFAYPRTAALRGVNLDVAAGEVVAVTGRSGSGKSTLLHVAAGLLRPASGTVHVLGQEVGALPDAAASSLRRKHIGLVLQHGLLVPELSVLANVTLPLVLEATHERASAQALAIDWLTRLEVADLAAAFPGELSGGQSQRVAVARALVAGPALVLADEPTGSLDSVGGEKLLDLLVSACRVGNRALVVVTHDNRVAAVADREVRLLDGAVEYEAVLA